MFRELGYGVVMFLSAMAGMLICATLFPTLDGAPVQESVIGAILGAASWLAYKYTVLTPRKPPRSK